MIKYIVKSGRKAREPRGAVPRRTRRGTHTTALFVRGCGMRGKTDKTQRPRGRRKDIAAIVAAVIIAAILIPVLAVNLTLIIKGSLNKDVPPDIGGIAPLAVTSGSMDGDREDGFGMGELIFVKVLGDDEKQELEVGDVVCYRKDGSYVTHRIIALNTDGNGAIESVVTQGDANNFNDGDIPVGDIFGKNTGSVAGLGSFAMFLQTPAGIIVCLGVPVVLFIIYDVIRITLYNRKVRAEEEGNGRDLEEELRAKDEEIRRLRAMAEQTQPAGESEKNDCGERPAAEDLHKRE